MSGPRAPEDLTGTVVRGVGFAGMGFVVSQALTLASYIVLARLATPADFGEFAAGSILTAIGMLFVESGMLAALVHYPGDVDEAASTALVAGLLGGFVLAALALTAAPLIGLYFGSSRIEHVAMATSGYFVLRQATIVPNALLQRNFSFVRRLVLEPAAVVAFGATSIIACAFGLGVWGLVAGTYASVTVDMALAWALVSWRPDLRSVSFEMWRRLVRYGRLVLGADVVSRIGSDAGTLLVGRYVGTAALGQFQYAFRVAQRPLSILVDSASYVLFPAFARIADDPGRFRQAFVRSMRSMSVVAFPASFILLPLGVPIAVLLFGDQWVVAGHALMAMCGYAAGRSFLTLAANVAKATGRTDVLFRIHTVAAVLLVAAMAALLPLGVVGVAAGLSVSSIGVALYSLLWIRRLVGVTFREAWLGIWPPLVAAGLMAGVLYVIEHYLVHAASHRPFVAAVLIALEAVGGVTIYVATLTALSPDTVRDVKGIAKSFRSRRATVATRINPEGS